jgi:hypothetical protein
MKDRKKCTKIVCPEDEPLTKRKKTYCKLRDIHIFEEANSRFGLPNNTMRDSGRSEYILSDKLNVPLSESPIKTKISLK